MQNARPQNPELPGEALPRFPSKEKVGSGPQAAQRDWGLRIAGILLLAGVALLWWLTSLVLDNHTEAFDEYLIQKFRNPANPADPFGPPAFEEAARDITGLGGYTVLTGLTISVVICLGLSGKHHAGWLLLGATVGGLVVMRVMKLLIDRPRPDLVPHLSHVASPSYPSGHAMLSAVVYLTLGAMLGLIVNRRPIRIFAVALALLLTILIGSSRVYLGVHYPSDVLGGWIAGFVWAVICWIVTRLLQRRGAVERSNGNDR